jgi:hypothetical protein
MNNVSPASPMINGESMCGEFQGKFTPPSVKPIVVEQDDVITSRVPLEPGIRMRMTRRP